MSRRTRTASKVPDWVWGAGLGALVIIFVGAFFIVRSATGGDASACDNDLPPPTSDTPVVDAEAFANEDAALKRVVDMLTAGDRAGAEAAFFGPVHNLTHAVHPLVREEDEDLGRELCEVVLDLENQLARGASDTSVALNVDRVRGLMRDAAVALGYPRP